MKRPISPVMPVPMDPELKSLIKRAAARTHLSQAAVMRTALRIGVPEVIRSFEARPGGSLFNIAPWTDAELARAYSNRKVDPDYQTAANIKGQSFPRD